MVDGGWCWWVVVVVEVVVLVVDGDIYICSSIDVTLTALSAHPWRSFG